MFCTKCGNENIEGANFCVKCGSAMAGAIQPPSSMHAETAVEPGPADYYRAVIGPHNTERYLQRFLAFDQAGKTSVGWHWAVFFVAVWRALYRKVWRLVALLMLGVPLVSAVIGGLCGLAGIHTMGLGGLLVGVVASYIYAPLNADAYYYRACQRHIAEARRRSPDPQQQLQILRARNATSWLAVMLPLSIVFLLGIAAAIAIPAYQGYIARSEINEAYVMTDRLRPAVENYMRQNQQCPTTASSGAAPAELTGVFVDNIVLGTSATDHSTCLIQATLKENLNIGSKAAGSSLTMSMAVDESGGFSWSCSGSASSDILPPDCRSEAAQ